MQSEQVDIAETLIRRAGIRLGEAYSYFWEATSPGLDDFKLLKLRQNEAESSIKRIRVFETGGWLL